MTSGRPIEVVAHRGASDDEPEHSLAAYLAAVEQGADAIECDVRLTADGSLVCVHDRRIDRTSTGRGAVSSKTLAELSSYDYSNADVWYDFEGPASDDSRTAVLTLTTLLETMLDASPTIRFAIETKHPVRYGGYVEQAVADMLRRFGLTASDSKPPRARVMSFSRLAVRRMTRLLPGTPTVLLMDGIPRRYRDGSLPRGVGIAGPSMEVLRRHPHYVEQVHGKGGRVHVWTVDEREDLDLCLAMGVDVVITNRPAHVLRWLGR